MNIQRLKFTLVIGMMMLCLSGCGMLSSDQKDLEPMNDVILETGDPNKPDPDRDE